MVFVGCLYELGVVMNETVFLTLVAAITFVVCVFILVDAMEDRNV